MLKQRSRWRRYSVTLGEGSEVYPRMVQRRENLMITSWTTTKACRGGIMLILFYRFVPILSISNILGHGTSWCRDQDKLQIFQLMLVGGSIYTWICKLLANVSLMHTLLLLNRAPAYFDLSILYPGHGTW